MFFGSLWRKSIAKNDYYIGDKGCVKIHLIKKKKKKRLLGLFFKRNLKGTFTVLPLLYHRAFWMDSALSKNLFLVLYCRIRSKKGQTVFGSISHKNTSFLFEICTVFCWQKVSFHGTCLRDVSQTFIVCLLISLSVLCKTSLHFQD